MILSYIKQVGKLSWGSGGYCAQMLLMHCCFAFVTWFTHHISLDAQKYKTDDHLKNMAK